jgi:hypothetical protein
VKWGIRCDFEVMATLGLACQAGLAIQQLHKDNRGRPHSRASSEFYGDRSCNFKEVVRHCAVSHRQQRVKVVAMVAPATQQVAENSGEAALVEALVGVQGRGRSASARQLQVRCSGVLVHKVVTKAGFVRSLGSSPEHQVWVFVRARIVRG